MEEEHDLYGLDDSYGDEVIHNEDVSSIEEANSNDNDEVNEHEEVNSDEVNSPKKNNTNEQEGNTEVESIEGNVEQTVSALDNSHDSSMDCYDPANDDNDDPHFSDDQIQTAVPLDMFAEFDQASDIPQDRPETDTAQTALQVAIAAPKYPASRKYIGEWYRSPSPEPELDQPCPPFTAAFGRTRERGVDDIDHIYKSRSELEKPQPHKKRTIQRSRSKLSLSMTSYEVQTDLAPPANWADDDDDEDMPAFQPYVPGSVALMYGVSSADNDQAEPQIPPNTQTAAVIAYTPGTIPSTTPSTGLDEDLSQPPSDEILAGDVALKMPSPAAYALKVKRQQLFLEMLAQQSDKVLPATPAESQELIHFLYNEKEIRNWEKMDAIQRLHNASAEVSDLQIQLSQSDLIMESEQEVRQGLEASLEATQKRSTQLENDLESAEVQISTLESQKDSLTKQLIELNKRRHQTSERCDAVEKQLENNRKAAASDMEDMAKELEKQKSLVANKIEYSEKQREAMKELEAKIKALESALKKCHDHSAALQTELDQLKADKESNTVDNDKTAELEAQIAKLQGQITDLGSQLTASKTQNEKYLQERKMIVDNARLLKYKLDRLERERDSGTNVQLAALKLEVTQLKQQIREIDTAKLECEQHGKQLQSQINSIQTGHNLILTIRNNASLAQDAKIAELEKAKTECEEHGAKLEKTNSELDKNLSDLQATHATKMTALEQAKTECEDHGAKLKETNSELTNHLVSLQTTLDAKASLLSQLEQAQATKDTADKGTQHDNAEDNNNNKEEDNSTHLRLRQEVELLEDISSDLRTELKLSQDRAAALAQRVTHLETTKQELEDAARGAALEACLNSRDASGRSIDAISAQHERTVEGLLEQIRRLQRGEGVVVGREAGRSLGPAPLPRSASPSPVRLGGGGGSSSGPVRPLSKERRAKYEEMRRRLRETRERERGVNETLVQQIEGYCARQYGLHMSEFRDKDVEVLWAHTYI